MNNLEEIIPTLKKYVLVDGFDIIVDLQKSHGSWVIDARSGKKYLDCFGQFSSQPVGWNHPYLVSNVGRLAKVSLTKLAHGDFYTKYYSDFMKVLSTILPEFTDFFLISGSGALAVENALKSAFDWKTQKLGIKNDENAINKLDIAHFENAFHGRSGYCLSLTNTDPVKTKWFPKFKWTRLPLNNDGLKILEEKLIKYNNIAATIIEPILAEGGDIHVNKDFIVNLRELTMKHDCLLIFDEVQTGLSTGKYWGYQHFDVVCDLLAFAKKMQVCGAATTNRIHEVKDNTFTVPSRINSTWGGDIVDIVRSTIILEAIQKYNLIEKSRKTGHYFVQKLNELSLKNVRGKGSMIAFDLESSEERDDFFTKLNEKIICLKCGKKSIRFRPHLTFDEEEVDFAVDHIKSVF